MGNSPKSKQTPMKKNELGNSKDELNKQNAKISYLIV